MPEAMVKPMIELPEVTPLLDQMAASLKDFLNERNLADPVMIGIRTGGVWIARALHQRLGFTEEPGELDISFYRDDFSRIGLNPKVSPSHLPFETDDRHIVLVDDVIMSGRTIRAAMNELFDYGRPSTITLVTLVDIGARELPVQPDIRGCQLSLPAHQRIQLSGPEDLIIELRDLA